MAQFDGEVRFTKVLNNDELRESLKGGWNPELPAIMDEFGVLLVGHRRLKVAIEEGIEPVIKTVVFGTGAQAEAERIRLANVSNLGAAPMTREDRQRQAERLYKNGLTMEAIGRMLGVSKKTISLDLNFIVTSSNNPKPKTASNPKGAGRPKKANKLQPERRKNTSVSAESAARRILDEGKSYQEIERETGLTNIVLRSAVAREEGRREPVIDRSELPMSSQRKLDALERQLRKQYEMKFTDAVAAGVREFLQETILPKHRKEQDTARRVLNARRGIMDKATFNRIRRALHPDSRNSISDNMLAAAFDAFMDLEKLLLDEKNSPTEWNKLPQSMADWDRMKAAATAARKAKRKGGNSAVRPF
jgi:transposase